MVGTLINVVVVLVGGGLGTLLGQRLPERIRESVLHGIGLVTLVLGLHLTTETHNILIVMGSVLIGAILGEWWRVDAGLERAGEWLREKTAKRLPDHSLGRFTEGFVTASLVFCVGPVTILGSIRDGLTGDFSLLSIKSMLDGFTALALASTMGIGVLFSIVTILLYQGGLSLLASVAQNVLSEAMIREMSATGGVLILAIGLLILDLKRIRVANLLPGLIVAPLIVAVLQALDVSIAL